MPLKLHARQGDIIVRKMAKTELFTDLADFVKMTGKSFAGDSSGHTHRLVGSALVRDMGNGRFQVRVAKTTKLVHAKPDGHKDIPMPKGDYEISRKRERGGQGDRLVVD